MKSIFFAIMLSMPLSAMDLDWTTAQDLQKTLHGDLQATNEATPASALLAHERSSLAERFPLPAQYFTQSFKQVADGKALELDIVYTIKQSLLNNHRMFCAEISENLSYTDSPLLEDSNEYILFSTFSPDERFLITVTSIAVSIKNLADGATKRIEHEIPHGGCSYVFSADKITLFFTGSNGIILMLNLKDPNNITLQKIAAGITDDNRSPFRLPNLEAGLLAINDDNTKLLVSKKNSVIIYNLIDLKNITSTKLIENTSCKPIITLAFASHDSMLVGFQDGTVVYYNLNASLDMVDLAQLPRDNRMYRKTNSGICQLAVLFPENPHMYLNHTIALSSDGRVVVVACQDQTVFYDVKNFYAEELSTPPVVFNRPPMSLLGVRGMQIPIEPTCMQFNANNTMLMIGFRDGSLTLYKISTDDMIDITAKSVNIYPFTTSNSIQAIVFSNAKTNLAVTLSERGESRICLWDLSNLNNIRHFFPSTMNEKTKSDAMPRSFSFNTDGSCLLIGNPPTRKNFELWPLTQFLDTLTFEQIKAIIDTSNNSDLLFHEPYNSILLSIPNEYLRKLIFKLICSQRGTRDAENKAVFAYKKRG